MTNRGVLSIASSGILYGLVTVGGSLLSRAGFSVLDISFFFIFFSILVLAPFALRKDRNIFSKMKFNWKFLLIYAFVNLVILLSQFGSLALGLGPPVVALLLYTQPMWTIIFSRFAFKEKITAVRLAIIALALIGVFFVTNPLSLLAQNQSAITSEHLTSSTLLIAEILALIGGVFLSLWIILGRKGRLNQIKEPVSLTFAVRTFSVIPVGMISFLAYVFGTRLFVSNSVDFSFNLTYLVLFAILAGALPDYLFYRGVDKVLAAHAGVILLLEPVSAAILSAIIGISVLSWLQLVGGCLILVSNFFVVSETNRIQG
jgi:drug/metabolite transporter (DMT)-like permease